jgi:hypothetical protein
VAISVMPTHAHRVVVAGGQERLAGGRAQGGGVEAAEAEPLSGQPLGVRGVARPSKGGGCPEAGVVDHHDHHIGGTGVAQWERTRWGSLAVGERCSIGGNIDGVRVLGVVGDQRLVRDPSDQIRPPTRVGVSLPLTMISKASALNATPSEHPALPRDLRPVFDRPPSRFTMRTVPGSIVSSLHSPGLFHES